MKIKKTKSPYTWSAWIGAIIVVIGFPMSAGWIAYTLIN